MRRRRSRLRRVGGAALALAAVAIGCGTTLEIRSIAIPLEPTDCRGKIPDAERETCRLFNEPGGIVLNQRMRYRVSVEAVGEPKLEISASPSLLSGIDHDRLLVVDYTRQPFASGELQLTLDDAQAVKTIGIESEPGELGAIHALGAASEATRDVQEAREKAAAE